MEQIAEVEPVEPITSPVPEEVVEVEKLLTFPEAIAEATIGKRIRRLEWPEDEYGYFKVFKDGDFLCVKTDKEYIWKISKEDASTEDWIAF